MAEESKGNETPPQQGDAQSAPPSQPAQNAAQNTPPQNGQQPQQQPQVVVPPAEPPPPPANAQEIIAAQQRQIAEQTAQVQALNRQMFAEAYANQPPAQQSPAPVMGGVFQQAAAQQQQQQPAGVNLPPGMTPQQVMQGVAQQRPQVQQQPQPQVQNPMIGGLSGLPNPAIAQGGPGAVAAAMVAAGLPDPAAPQNGVTVAQLAQNASIQGAPPPSYVHPQGQQPQQQQQSNTDQKPRIRWYPGRNSPTDIELADSIISGLPDGPDQEPDAQAKVVAALLMEILSLRERVTELEQMGSQQVEQRLSTLERTLFEQTQALNQRARAFREEQERLAAQENQQNQPTQTPDQNE